MGSSGMEIDQTSTIEKVEPFYLVSLLNSHSPSVCTQHIAARGSLSECIIFCSELSRGIPLGKVLVKVITMAQKALHDRAPTKSLLSDSLRFSLTGLPAIFSYILGSPRLSAFVLSVLLAQSALSLDVYIAHFVTSFHLKFQRPLPGTHYVPSLLYFFHSNDHLAYYSFC